MAETASVDGLKIRVENIYKIFGPDLSMAMEEVGKGISKSDLLDKTGHVIGLRNVSLDIKSGETFVVMGLSGSGKSTLIRHFNRLIEPTSGRILVDGRNVLELSPKDLREFRRSKISMVFQRFGLLPHKTVLENVMYGLDISGIERSKARERGMEQIELVGLKGHEDQYPRQLSGGMQQRVGLARALATNAEIMLMDEAFSALDPLIRNDMQSQLKDLQSRLHKTIVFITHDLDEALRLGDHIAILNDGELRQVGTGDEVLLKPADDYVERFVRDVNRARVVMIGSLVQPSVTLAVSECTDDRCRNLLREKQAIVLTGSDGKPGWIVSREFAQQCGSEIAAKAKERATALCLPEDTSLEEGFAMLSKSAHPIVVTGKSAAPVGIVSHQSVLKALARN